MNESTPITPKKRGTRSRRRPLLDRRELLGRLKPVAYDEGPAIPQHELEKLQLADTLLMLAGISHQSDYELCGEVAKHLLGHRPDPSSQEDDYK